VKLEAIGSHWKPLGDNFKFFQKKTKKVAPFYSKFMSKLKFLRDSFRQKPDSGLSSNSIFHFMDSYII